MPRSAALPSIRAGIAATGPSACPRCTQRCGALFAPHGGPGGTSHQRQPVSKMSNKVCRIFRNGAWGLPRLRCGGAGGKPSSHKRHSTSLTPAKRPAILPSYVQIEQSSTKIILVGYIHHISPSESVQNRQSLRRKSLSGYQPICGFAPRRSQGLLLVGCGRARPVPTGLQRMARRQAVEKSSGTRAPQGRTVSCSSAL